MLTTHHQHRPHPSHLPSPPHRLTLSPILHPSTPLPLIIGMPLRVILRLPDKLTQPILPRWIDPLQVVNRTAPDIENSHHPRRMRGRLLDNGDAVLKLPNMLPPPLRPLQQPWPSLHTQYRHPHLQPRQQRQPQPHRRCLSRHPFTSQMVHHSRHPNLRNDPPAILIRDCSHSIR